MKGILFRLIASVVEFEDLKRLLMQYSLDLDMLTEQEKVLWQNIVRVAEEERMQELELVIDQMV
jgi:hypothetical protein